MPIIPLKQSITVVRYGDIDEWGGGNVKETLTFRARVDEKTQVVQNQFGDESVSSAEIMLDKLADIRYDDDIVYEDELGREIKRKPLRIEPLRGVNGKAILTVVYV